MKTISLFFLLIFFQNASVFSQTDRDLEIMEQVRTDYENGNYFKVVNDITPLIRKYPESEGLLQYRGHSNMQLENFTEAITDFELIVKIDPISNNVNDVLGAIYFRKKNYKKAIYYSLKGYDRDKNSFPVTMILSASYLHTGNYTLASDFFDRTLELIQSESQFKGVLEILSKEIKNGANAQEVKKIYKNLENQFYLYYKNNLNKSIKIVPQARHTAGINSINLGTSQDIYITGSDDYSIKIYDANSHLLKRTITEGINGGITKAILSPNEQLIAGIQRVTGGDPTIKIWDTYNGELILRLQGFYNSLPRDIEFAKGGNHIASCSGDSIKIWNLVLPNSPVSFSIKNADFSQIEYYDQGSKMISAGSDSFIRIWDLETKEVLKEHKFSEGQVHSMLLINNEKYLVSLHQNEQTNNSHLNIWDLSNFTLIHQEPLGEIRFLYFPLCEYKNTLLYGQEDTLVALDLVNFKILNKKDFSDDSAFLFSDVTAINAWKGNIIVAIGGVTELIDFVVLNEQLVKINTIGVNSRKNYGTKIRLAENGKNIFLDDWTIDSIGMILDAFTFEEINYDIFNYSKPKFNNIVDSLKKTPSFDLIQYNNDSTLLGLINENFDVFVFDLTTGNKLFEGSFLYDKYRKINISFTEDNKLVAFGTAYEMIVYDLVTKEVLINKIFEKGADELIMYKKGRMIASVHSREKDKKGELIIWNIDKNGDQLMEFEVPSAASNLLCFSQNGEKIAWAGGVILSRNHFPIIVWDLNTREQAFTLKGHRSFSKSIFFYNNDNILVSCANDGEIKFWDLITHVEIGTLIIEDDEDYIFYTPSNYYLSRVENSFNSIAFLINEKVYPFEQFDLIFHRPDFILDKIGGSSLELVNAYYSAFRKRLVKMNLDFDLLDVNNELPIVEIVSKTNTSLVKESLLKIKLKITSETSKLHQINVWINDVPIYGIKGINLREKNVQNWTQDLALTLSQGESKIQVSALNQGGAESLKETFYITYDAPEKKPDLYLITIGAEKFNNPTQDLSYPLKDLRDFSQLFQPVSDKYQNVYIDSLFNEDVSLENLIKVKQTLLKSKVDDHVILFVAGHGVVDKDLDYYFANSDMDFSNPADKGIPYEALESLLDGIPARQKLFLMDACHSGEIDKENVKLLKLEQPKQENIRFRSFETSPQPKQIGLENSFELMKQLFIDLRRGTGATVISSAGGVEFAWEGEKWKNSVFTYCLLSALKDLKADANGDKQVTVSELRDYLTFEVPQLTGNHQRPTMRVENISNDWRIW